MFKRVIIFFKFLFKVFQANVNDDTNKTVLFKPFHVAQYIRLYPTKCSNTCALRFELYGCNLTTCKGRFLQTLLVKDINIYSYYPIVLRWLQITRETSTNITPYLYSRDIRDFACTQIKIWRVGWKRHNSKNYLTSNSWNVSLEIWYWIS